MRIYIAEDNFESFLLLKEILRPYNFVITNAKNGRELIDLMEIELPDLVLLDVNMPEMNGFDVLKTIKERGYDTPVIAQTSFAMKNDREKLMELGCNDYVSKPINIIEFVKKIERFTV